MWLYDPVAPKAALTPRKGLFGLPETACEASLPSGSIVRLQNSANTRDRGYVVQWLHPRHTGVSKLVAGYQVHTAAGGCALAICKCRSSSTHPASVRGQKWDPGSHSLAKARLPRRLCWRDGRGEHRASSMYLLYNHFADGRSRVGKRRLMFRGGYQEGCIWRREESCQTRKFRLGGRRRGEGKAHTHVDTRSYDTHQASLQRPLLPFQKFPTLPPVSCASFVSRLRRI
jgi:hypothetical protein